MYFSLDNDIITQKSIIVNIEEQFVCDTNE